MMRALVVQIFSLAILLISFTLTSPVPNPTNTLLIRDTDDNESINRDIASIINLSRSEASGNELESWTCVHGQRNCYFHKQVIKDESRDLAARSDQGTADVAEVATDAEMNSERPGSCYLFRKIPTRRRLSKCFHFKRRSLPGGPGRRDRYEGTDRDASAVVKRVEISTTVSSGRLVSRNDLGSSSSKKRLFNRQLINSSSPLLNKPCAQDIIKEYQDIDLDTMSIDDKKTLLIKIIDCMYEPYKTSRDTTEGDATGTFFQAESCPIDLFEDSYLQAYWARFRNRDKINWWLILARCFQSVPGGPNQRPLHQAHDGEAVKIQGCLKHAAQHWKGNISARRDVVALVATMRRCIEL